MKRMGACLGTSALSLLVIGACCGLPLACRAQSADAGGSGASSSPTASGGPASGLLSAPSAGSLLQGGPPQPGGPGPSPLPTTAGETMRDRISSAIGLQPAASGDQPAVRFTPSISLQQGWTSNAINVPGLNGKSAYITQISPGLAVNAEAMRVQGSLFYMPTLNIYEGAKAQNNVAQNLTLHGHADLLADRLFLDTSAFATQQTIAGGFGPTGTVATNQANTAQVYSFALAPRYLQRLGEFGMIEVGGSVGETAQLIPGNAAVALPSQHATTTEEHITFQSGDAFGRWLSQALIEATQASGTGVLSDAHQNTVSYEAGYGITRHMTVLGTIGWDDIHYGGVPPVTINSALWNIGAQWTPNPDSQITLRYGRKDGIDAPFVSAFYQPTPRTRVTATYSSTVSTDQEQLQASLNNATTDASGYLVNAMTGQSLTAGNNFLGLSASVYRLTTGMITGTLLLNHDTLQLGFNHQSQQPLNTYRANTPLISQTGNYGTFSWQHDLSEVVTTGVYLQYGVLQSETNGNGQDSTVFVAGAQVNYAISTTLHANLTYSHTASGLRSQYYDNNVDYVMAGLAKSF